MTMNDNEIKKIVSDHQYFIYEDCDGWEEMVANLSYRDLREIDLSYANLSGANLSHANLSGANLSGANLVDADLTHANLWGADLTHADLSGANLRRADLVDADLRGAYLDGADLDGAYLTHADLRGAGLTSADLREATLMDADLTDANLWGANLTDANLRGARLDFVYAMPFIPFACPDYGSFIGFKKAGGYIVMLEILEDAKRVSATGRKCRCDKAKVVEIQTLSGESTALTEVSSDHDRGFIYRVGEVVKESNFDPNRWNECSAGIHFFVNRQEAVEY